MVAVVEAPGVVERAGRFVQAVAGGLEAADVLIVDLIGSDARQRFPCLAACGDLVVAEGNVVIGTVAEAGIDQTVGLQALDRVIDAAGLLCVDGHGNVEPCKEHVAVVGHDLLDLRQNLLLKADGEILVIHRREVPAVVPRNARAGNVTGQVAAAVVFVPVEVLRVVEAELQTVLLACSGKLGDEVALAGGRVIDVVGVNGGAEQRKAVVVLGRDDEVLHADVACKADDLLRIKIDRVEDRCQLFVFRDRDRMVRADPFGICRGRLALVFARQQRIKTEVHHHAVAGFFEVSNIGIHGKYSFV